MARELWLLRHGEAERHPGRLDAQRRLTQLGEVQARDAGAALRRLGLVFHRAITSPKLRALDTARLACEPLGVQPEVDDSLAWGFDAAAGRRLLQPVEPGGRVLMVGHNPDFEDVVRELTGARIVLRKGGLAGVLVGRHAPELVALLSPGDVAAIAQRGR